MKYNNIKRDILLYVEWGINDEEKTIKLGEFLIYLSRKTDVISFEFSTKTTKDILLNICKYGLNDVFNEITQNISIPIHLHGKYNYYNNLTLTHQECTLLEIICINDYNINPNWFDINTKQTPLIISIQNYCHEMVDLLLKNGA